MKKIKNNIIICMVLVLMLSVMGCSGKSNTQSKDSKEESSKNTIESTTTKETTEEMVVPYEDMYIEELNNNKSIISMYNSSMSESDNVNSKICITNLAGDDIPELMYVYFNEDDGKEYLRIVGCDNGVKKVVYDDVIDITPWGDSYYFFKTNDGKLNYYIGYGDNEYHDMYCTFEEKADGKLSIEQRVLMTSWMDPMDGNMGYNYTVNDVEISEEEFNAKEKSLISNIDVICIYDNFGLTALKGKVASFSDIAMGCEDAIIYLGGTTEDVQSTENVANDTDNTTLESTFKDYYMLDYWVFETILWGFYPGADMSDFACDIKDSNKDGKSELYITMPGEVMGMTRAANYIITHYQMPGIYVFTDSSAAGDARFLLSTSEDAIYLNKYYGTVKNVLSSLYLIENNTWNLKRNAKGAVTDETLPMQFECVWDGESVSYEEWDQRYDACGFTELSDRTSELFPIETSDGLDALMNGVENHMDEIGATYSIVRDDKDEAGHRGVEYQVYGYWNIWAQNVNTEYAFGKESFVDFTPEMPVYITLYETSEGTNIFVSEYGTGYSQY